MEELTRFLTQTGDLIVDFLGRPEVLIQVAIVGSLFLPALFLSWRVEPVLEERARQIKGMPGVLRLIVAFMRRLEWLFYIILLGVAYVVTSVVAWPASNYIIYSAMLLSLAWLTIAVFSHTIKSRALRRVLSIGAWIYVAVAILGITNDVAQVLDNPAVEFDDFRLSFLSGIKAILLLGVLLWLASSLGNFLDRKIQSSDELTPSLARADRQGSAHLTLRWSGAVRAFERRHQPNGVDRAFRRHRRRHRLRSAESRL